MNLINTKIRVFNPEVKNIVYNRLVELGCEPNDYIANYEDYSFLYMESECSNQVSIGFGQCADSFERDFFKEITITDLFLMKPIRKITIDGKDIEISEESFQALRKQLCE